MKFLVAGLVLMTSLVTFAADCNLGLKGHGDLDIEKIRSIALKKGYVLNEYGNASRFLSVGAIQYCFDKGPKYITLVGASAALYDSETKKYSEHVSKEDLAVIVGREEIRYKKLAIKAVKKLFKNLPYCSK